MSASTLPESAEAVQKRQQEDAERLFERLNAIHVPDLTVNFTLQASSVVLPGVLIRFVALAVLLRLNSAKKWHVALQQKALPEPLRRWLGVEEMVAFIEQATVDWMPAKTFAQALTWQVVQCLTQCGMPQPVAIIRQTIRDLLLRDARVSEGGIVLDRRFWRRFAEKGTRRASAGLVEECRERMEFVLGQVDLSEAAEPRWRELPQLTDEEHATLEAAQVAEPHERLQALQEAFDAGHFDFIVPLLASSYSRLGRRAHHPLLMWKVWLTMLAMGCWHAGTFLGSVDDSLQLRLFLEVMSHESLPSERRIKGFATERMAPVIEYLVLWHQFLLIGSEGIEIGSDFGTDGAEMHAQARMKSDAPSMYLAPLWSWLIGECRRFCQATGRDSLSEADREVLLQAFDELDWKALGSLGRNRWPWLRKICDILGGGSVTPVPGPAVLNALPRDGPIPADVNAFARGLAAEFFQRVEALGEKFDASVYYDPECGARSKRGKTTYGYGIQFLADLRFGFIWTFAVFRAGQGFQPMVADWVIRMKQTFALGPIRLTSDSEFTIAKAIHQWHDREILHYGPRANIDRKQKDVFLEEDFEVHDLYAVCPNGKRLNRKPNIFVRGSNEQWRYQAKGTDCCGCPLRAQCTQGKGPKMLCVNVYREDLALHAKRMKADPQETRDLMGRHRAMSEGMVNNLMNHQGIRYAYWKGLALARLQAGLAIVMSNVLKWHKLRHGRLVPMTLKPAA